MQLPGTHVIMADADTTVEDAAPQDLNVSATSVGSKVGRTHKPRTKGLLKKLQSQVGVCSQNHMTCAEIARLC